MEFTQAYCCCFCPEEPTEDELLSDYQFECPLHLQNGILDDSGSFDCTYRDLVQSGNIPEVTGVLMILCPVDYDITVLLRRHRITINSAKIQYDIGRGNCLNFPRTLIRLADCLMELPGLSSLKIGFNWDCSIPKEFFARLVCLANLRRLSLSGLFEFLSVPLQCNSVEHLSLFEIPSRKESSCLIDLSSLCQLSTADISAERKLILPAENSRLSALRLSRITSLQSAKLSITVLYIAECAPNVLRQLLEATDPAILTELSIKNLSPIMVDMEIDARQLRLLSLSRISLVNIVTSEETPVKCLDLDCTTITTANTGLKLNSVSAYVKYIEIRHLNKLCFDGNILKRLGLERKQGVREPADLIIPVMPEVNKLAHNLELFATYVTITEFPEMPCLKYLALYSCADWYFAIGKVPELVELVLEYPEHMMAQMMPQQCYGPFNYWSSHNDIKEFEFPII